jgi:hypothetical protein
MESDLRYFQRRAAAETLAAKRSITPEARNRHLELAEKYSALVMAGQSSVPQRKSVAA